MARSQWLAAVVAVWGLTGAASGVGADEVLRYELTPAFGEGRLHVSLSWQTGRREQSVLVVSQRVGPINDVPAMLENLRFSCGSRRDTGGSWMLTHRPEETVRCDYDVVPGRRAFDDWDNTHYPITTTSFFHGLGTAFLLAPNSGAGVPDEFDVVLRWKLPAGFKAACSWGVGRHVGARIRALDLRQSVYLAGRLKTTSREQGGRSVSVVMVDRFDFSLDEFAERTTTIIRHQCEFMDEKEFPDFVVTAIPLGEPLKPGESRIAGSGLYKSFALFVAPESVLDDAVEHLFSHELFHHWNGKLLSAQQPERLVYWFIEGFTDYYALRILYESGYWKPETYAKWINRHVSEYFRNPAINASNEEINEDYWNKRNTVGEVAYERGLLLGLRWHSLARKKGVADGIDRLFKRLVARGRGDGLQVSNGVIRDAGRELLGAWFAAEFDRYVTRAETIDLPANVLAPQLIGRHVEVYEYELGFDQLRSLADQKVHGLVVGSAAERAGLREGDQLVGWSAKADAEQLAQLRVQRGGNVKTIVYYPRGAKHTVVQFQVAE